MFCFGYYAFASVDRHFPIGLSLKTNQRPTSADCNKLAPPVGRAKWHGICAPLLDGRSFLSR